MDGNFGLAIYDGYVRKSKHKLNKNGGFTCLLK